MRKSYIVSYDVSDDKRLRKVFKVMRGWGDHLQYSVFRCELSRRELLMLMADLDDVIQHAEDQVLIVDLGPADGRAQSCMRALGRPYTHAERHAIVV